MSFDTPGTEAIPAIVLPGSARPVRFRIIALLALFSLVAYVLRMNISVAAKFMMPDLGLTQIQMGEIFGAFMLGYAIFQVPWGLLGDRFEPRRVLAIASLVWAITTALTGFLPVRLPRGEAAAFASLLMLRFLLGAGEAALYPLAARAVGNWMRESERAFAYSIIIAAAAAGSAFTGPMVAWSMVAFGWRAAYYLCSILALVIGGLWYWYARDQPEVVAPVRAPSESWLPLLRNRDLILICASYFLSSYVLFTFIFWFYLYLVDARGFSVLSGGLFTSMPYILALAVVPAAGYLSDWLSNLFGTRRGRRFVAIAGFGIAAVTLFLGTRAANAYAAIGALSISVASMMATEGPFWSSTIDVAGRHAGAAGGIMNMAGNLGGVASTSLVPLLVKKLGWGVALGSCSAVAIAGGLLWLLIRVDPPSIVKSEA